MCVFDAQAVVPKCTLKTCVPFLADVPPEWDVSLVDTPGFGEFDSCVEALAKEALKSSSVCVYITAYNDLRAQANGDYLRFILQHDQGTSYICSYACSFHIIVQCYMVHNLLISKKRHGL